MCDDLWCLKKHTQDSEKSTPTDLTTESRGIMSGVYKKATFNVDYFNAIAYVADLNLSIADTKK